MRNKFIRTLGILALSAGMLPFGSCTKDLDQSPSYLASADVIYRDPAQITQVLARLYAGLAVTGQNGGAGPGAAQADLAFIDEGYSNYIRAYFKAQELTTDEAIIAWGDAGLPDYNRLTWNADNQFIRAMYERIFFQITACNEFIRQTSDDKLASRGITGADATKIQQYRSEARFLRALSYYHAIDMFGNVPFVTDQSPVGGNPTQGSRTEIYSFIESELRAIESNMPAPRSAYARADKAALWSLQTTLYLNAKVYTGTARNTEAVAAAAKVRGAGYTLAPKYTDLFLADNDRSTAKNEIIFPIAFDGINTQNYGGTTFLVHASIGGTMPASEFGVGGGWFGLRAKPSLVDLFPGAPTSTTDQRALFYTSGQNRVIADPSTFSDGYAVTKWRNVTSDGKPGKDATATFADTDFPMFRLADVQLMYAEAILRGGQGGTKQDALDAVNAIRLRAGAPALAAFNGDGLQDILDERGRELYWEGHRRTDLIRFDKYVSGYNWAFKGNRGPSDITTGRDVEAFRVLFPIPTSDLVANPTLKQNTGY